MTVKDTFASRFDCYMMNKDVQVKTLVELEEQDHGFGKNKVAADLIFLIEDSDMYARMLEHKLGQSKKYRFRQFSYGEEAVLHLSEQPRCIILDYNLPGMNGLETLKAIRKTDFSIPVLVLSAQPDLKIAIQMVGEGAAEYITKDDDTLNELNKALEKLLV